MNSPDMMSTGFAFAAKAHAGQVRKGTEIPYISHPMAVCAMVLENGGNTDQALAALLHDVVEDTSITVEEIAALFGPDVARMVAESSAMPVPGVSWRDRKTAYLASIGDKSTDSLLVIACDKVHNLHCIVEDVAHQGIGTLQRFSGGEAGVVWYYNNLFAALRGKMPYALQRRFFVLLQRLNAQREGLSC